jgi:hypothetical protein
MSTYIAIIIVLICYRAQQIPPATVVTLDDGHIGRNMKWKKKLKSFSFKNSVAYETVCQSHSLVKFSLSHSAHQ